MEADLYVTATSEWLMLSEIPIGEVVLYNVLFFDVEPESLILPSQTG